MARILIGWELGANRGHISRILPVAEALSEQGHEVALALQNIGLVPPEWLAAFSLYQAPLWPRLLANNVAPPGAGAASMADILARLGLDRVETLPGLVAAWHGIFAGFQPDLAIGDFAPSLIVAARGRVPVIAMGTGFSLPPGEMAAFPELAGRPPVTNADAVLDCANHGLAAIGEPPLAGLPEMFAATRALVGDFDLLDPYRQWRYDVLFAPAVAEPRPQIAPVGGEEVFVYAFERAMNIKAFWDGLAASGLPIRVHIPGVSKALADALRGRGFAFEPRPLPFAEIAARSRLVLSHGGHGFVCSALLAGLPQIITHYDLEKAHNAAVLTKEKLGGQVALTAIRPDPFAKSLRDYHAAEEPQRLVRAAAPQFQAAMGSGATQDVLATVDELLE